MPQHIVNVFNFDDLQSLEDFLRNFLEILGVILGDKHPLDKPAMGGEKLFAQAADGAGTRPLSVTSPVMARSFRTGNPKIAETILVTSVIPAEGPSLGMAPSGT